MRIRPDAHDNWFYIPRRQNPDTAELYWRHNWGEFSDFQEIRFEKHLKKYPALLNHYYKLNGSKLRRVLMDEPLFLGQAGLERVLYPKQHAYI